MLKNKLMRRALVATLVTSASVAAMVPATPAHAITPTAVIDANTIWLRNTQEPRTWPYWPWDGDEPEIATVAYRSTPGVVGSTRAWMVGDTRELHSGASRGTVVNIPDSVGRAQFDNVSLRTPAQMLAGQMPELIGTITIAFESDGTSNDLLTSLIRTYVVPAVRTQIAGLLEPLQLGSFPSDSVLRDRFNRAVSAVKSAADLAFWQKLAIWLASGTDPDDRVGYGISIFAAVDPSLASFADDLLGGLVTAPTGIGGALAPRTFTEEYVGDHCDYQASFAVS